MKWFLRICLTGIALVGAMLLIFRTPDTDAAEMRAKYGGEPSQFVTMPNGQEVHFRDEGPKDAPAIILLHGSSADLHTWQPWTEALREDYRVIRFDQIGHGLTGPAVGGSYELDDFIAGVNLIADHLELDTFVLGGNSMGGWISAGYALEHSDRLAGLILVDASGSPVRRKKGGGGNIGFSIAGMPVLNQVMKIVTPRRLVERSYRQSVSNQEIITPEGVDRYWELLRYPGNRAATIARFNTPRVIYTEEQIATVNVPTLVMWGTQDALVPVEAGRWYHKQLPNSVLAEYSGIGHLPHEEEPGTLSDLQKWLANLEFIAQ